MESEKKDGVDPGDQFVQPVRMKDFWRINQVLLLGFRCVFQTKFGITDLNEYCLLEIFSLKSLTLMDLCSLAETCTNFQHIITERIFPREFHVDITRDGNYQFKTTHYLHSSYHRAHSAHESERLFKNFGSIVTAISIRNVEVRNHHILC